MTVVPETITTFASLDKLLKASFRSSCPMSKGPTCQNVLAWFKETFFLGKPKWTPDDTPNLQGKVIIVTGGNAGLGFDTVKHLLKHDAKVYIASRNELKAHNAIQQLEQETGKVALFLKLDLSDLSSIQQAAEEFQRKEDSLHVLYNNAGIFAPVELTADGYDLIFQTNVTGHFYFTKLLLPLLLSTAKTALKGDVRIINMSSCSHHLARQKPVDFEALCDTPTRKKYKWSEFYQESKFGMTLFSNELAKRYGDQNIVSVAVHPGSFSTNITTESKKRFPSRLILAIIFLGYPDKWRSYTQLWAGTAPEAAEMNGKYVVPWGKAGVPRPETYDPMLIGEVWSWMEDRVREHESKLLKSE